VSGDLVFGAFALLFGAVTLVGRVVAPQSALFSKLDAMKQAYGDRAGTALHVIAYTAVPLVAGVVLVGGALARG